MRLREIVRVARQDPATRAAGESVLTVRVNQPRCKRARRAGHPETTSYDYRSVKADFLDGRSGFLLVPL